MCVQKVKSGEKKEPTVQIEKDELGCGSVVENLPGSAKAWVPSLA